MRLKLGNVNMYLVGERSPLTANRVRAQKYRIIWDVRNEKPLVLTIQGKKTLLVWTGQHRRRALEAILFLRMPLNNYQGRNAARMWVKLQARRGVIVLPNYHIELS